MPPYQALPDEKPWLGTLQKLQEQAGKKLSKLQTDTGGEAF